MGPTWEKHGKARGMWVWDLNGKRHETHMGPTSTNDTHRRMRDGRLLTIVGSETCQ